MLALTLSVLVASRCSAWASLSSLASYMQDGLNCAVVCARQHTVAARIFGVGPTLQVFNAVRRM